jgi:hypothetical protein
LAAHKPLHALPRRRRMGVPRLRWRRRAAHQRQRAPRRVTPRRCQVSPGSPRHGLSLAPRAARPCGSLPATGPVAGGARLLPRHAVPGGGPRLRAPPPWFCDEPRLWMALRSCLPRAAYFAALLVGQSPPTHAALMVYPVAALPPHIPCPGVNFGPPCLSACRHAPSAAQTALPAGRTSPKKPCNPALRAPALPPGPRGNSLMLVDDRLAGVHGWGPAGARRFPRGCACHVKRCPLVACVPLAGRGCGWMGC